MSDKRKVFEGNFQLSTATLISGNNHAKVALLAKFAGMAWPSSSSFYRIQRLFAIPAIGHFYAKMEADVLRNAATRQVIVGGDYTNHRLIL